MSKTRTLIFIVLALALTLTSLALSRRDSRDWRANRSRRLFPFPWQDAAGIVIKRPGGEELVFSRKPGGEWQIRVGDDLQDSLNPAAAQAVEALATLAWREAQSGRKAPDPGQAVTLTATSQSGQKVSFAFGDVQNNLRAAVIDNSPEPVYGVNQDLLNFLDWPQERFRNLHLASPPGSLKPKRISLVPGGGDASLAITLERTPAGWRQTLPIPWPVDEARLDLLMRWLDRLRGDAIAAEQSGDLAWFGFTPDSTRIEVWYDAPEGEVRRRIEIGKEAEPGHVYIRDAGRNPIFSLPAEILAEISIDVAREHPVLWRNFYRKRALDLLEGKTPESIVVERLLPEPEKLTLLPVNDAAGQRWQGTLETSAGVQTFPVDPPDPNDNMRPLSALLTGLSNVRVKTFLADLPPGAETESLTEYPAWRITPRLPGAVAQPVVLTIYAHDREGNLPTGKPYLAGRAEPLELKALPGLPEKVGFAFSLSSEPAVMETFGELSYLLCLPPYRYRAAKVIDSRPKSWTRVEIAKDGGTMTYIRNANDVNEQWWRLDVDKQPLMDDNNAFINVLLELSQLKSEGFVSDGKGDIGEFGLDRPEITAIVYSSADPQKPESGEKRLFQLSIGAAAGRNMCYARLGDAGPVFLLPARMGKALGETYH